MNEPARKPVAPVRPVKHPFRRAVLSGLAIVMPPLLTVVIFLWVFSTIDQYILEPLKGAARTVIVWQIQDIRVVEQRPDPPKQQQIGGKPYQLVGDNQYVPGHVYTTVMEHTGGEEMPRSAKGVYRVFVDATYLRPHVVVPAFVCVFILLMYLLGKFMAAGVGRMMVGSFERGVHRLPLIRAVYGSVKQVTDFLFTESEVEYTRVVAVEYPRMGIWSLGFVTGESLRDFHIYAGEGVVTVLIPTSPAPFTGYTVTVKKSEAYDLDMTVDQALQFIVSCGVAVTPEQIPTLENINRRQQAMLEKRAGKIEPLSAPTTGGAER